MKSMMRAVPLSLALALALVAPAAAATTDGRTGARSAQAAPPDDAPVLPSRVAAPIRRAQRALDNAEQHIDEGEYKQSAVSLRAVRSNMYRADRAARRQLAAPPADPEAETTAGPDSVMAVLDLQHNITVAVAGLFDTNSKGVVDALSLATFRTLNARDKLLDTVIALDPEGDGAPFADTMPDTLDAYTDEVANLTEALDNDSLSTGGRRVVRAAKTQVENTQAKVNAAYGGGE
jgi:hypothetical protein